MRKRITENLITVKSAADADFEKGKEYEYVSVGLGKEDDFKDLDLTGKLALIQRGEIPFSEKIANAFHHGAAGALVYNNVEGSNLEWQLMGDAKRSHLSLFQNVMGKLLRQVPTKLSLTMPWPTVHLQRQINCLISQVGE